MRFWRMKASMRKSACRKAEARDVSSTALYVRPALDGLRLNIALEDDGKCILGAAYESSRPYKTAALTDDPTCDASNVGVI